MRGQLRAPQVPWALEEHTQVCCRQVLWKIGMRQTVWPRPSFRGSTPGAYRPNQLCEAAQAQRRGRVPCPTASGFTVCLLAPTTFANCDPLDTGRRRRCVFLQNV